MNNICVLCGNQKKDELIYSLLVRHPDMLCITCHKKIYRLRAYDFFGLKVDDPLKNYNAEKYGITTPT